MIDAPIAADSETLLAVLEALLVPVSWIPGMQQGLMNFLLHSSSGWTAAGKYIFLMFPLFLFIGAMWCTMLSVYTVPFRSGRIRFASTMLIAWWDAARAVWTFWIGILRFLLVAVGWVFNLARVAVKFSVEVLRQILVAPFTMTGKLSRDYLRPGVHWIAFLLLVGWCLLEATIFTYVMFPTVSEVLAGLVGSGVPALTGPLLFIFLLLLIMGSFTCLQTLQDAVKLRQFKFIVQMIIIELFVMCFEVMFLYRELVDAVTPWIAQQTGEQLGALPVLLLATFALIGVRGMTWFLFGMYGTPPLLAFISRRPLEQPVQGENHPVHVTEEAPWWRAPLQEFKQETEWLHHKSDELLEYLTLPVLQVIAAAVNYAMILLNSRPVFSLPLSSLSEVMKTRTILENLRMEPNRVDQ